MPSIRSAALTTADATAAWTAIVLTGGSGTRLGGRSKAEVVLGEATLLEHVLQGLPPGVNVVVVGPEPTTPSRTVIVTRESPAGGGPVAALAAGLQLVTTPLVGVIATDMPFASSLLAGLTATIPPDADALVPLDATGRRQPLCAAYRSAALHRAVQSLGIVENASLRSLIEHLAVAETTAARAADLEDIDTPSDLDRSQAIMRVTKGKSTWMTG
jgi:molybdopterin-guanine dinucleotide biosynthesis protein A